MELWGVIGVVRSALSVAGMAAKTVGTNEEGIIQVATAEGEVEEVGIIKIKIIVMVTITGLGMVGKVIEITGGDDRI